MHILIISGEGDLRSYIYDTGIGLNFIRVKDIDVLSGGRVKITLESIKKER